MNDDENKKLTELHRYFMEPLSKNGKSRAEEIDQLLSAARAGKLTARAILWTLGFAAAVGGAVAAVRAGFGVHPK